MEDREEGRLRLPDPRRRDEQDMGCGEDTWDRADLGLRERLDSEGPHHVEDPGVETEVVHARR